MSLFQARLDPSIPRTNEERQTRSKVLAEDVLRRLDDVASLDQDRILRSYLTLVQATLRTSFYQRTTDGRPKPYIAFKFDSRAIPDLPAPRPRYEIFAYSPRFEGVHLRFGAVARGGLRWSDRREDFRTKVLGLVKAQSVKNAVIVPVGAKGGFVLKQAPAQTDREAFHAEGWPATRSSSPACSTSPTTSWPERSYHPRMWSVTTGTIRTSSWPRTRAPRRSPTLPTASPSRTASGLAMRSPPVGPRVTTIRRWRSPAKGAWESVRRHFREMDVDIQRQDFTAVGIGDMSGDVFGNGMLLSAHTRVVAAFDHRHVFVDPDPDAARSLVERRRLFDLPRSSWDDYDRSLVSAGGGVWPRTAKSIPVSAEMRRALGIDDGSVDSLPPAELIRAILRAPVDLLWNGGIGTYVKSTEESHADVGDKSNDGVRVNGGQVRAKVIGEGGNLGLTQRGRVEYALTGGTVNVAGVREAHICTDFIDNSAGVDCSDHEVNIKILLGGAVADGELSLAERDELLAQMTDEVAALVLRDNYDQANTLGASRTQAAPLLPVHRRMIADMEKAGLDRTLEALPSDEALAARVTAGAGLSSPELAILLAYAKINATREIQASSLPDDPWTRQVLLEYFPTPLQERFADRMPGHRLRRELVTTQVVNEAVNRGGLSFLYRAREETGASAADVLRAYVVVREVYDLRALWKAIEGLNGTVPASAQTSLILEVRRVIDRAVRWLVTNRRTAIDVTAEIARLRPGVSTLLPLLPDLFQGRERDELQAHITSLTLVGMPKDVAGWGTRVMYGFGLLDVVEVAHATGRDVTEVASVYFVLSERFRVDELLSKISALPRQDRWQTMARMALRYDLYAALSELTVEVLASSEPDRLSNGPGRPVGEGERSKHRPDHEHAHRVRRLGRRPGAAVGAATPDPHPRPSEPPTGRPTTRLTAIRRRGADQPGLVGKHHRLNPISQIQLGEDMRDMGLDRVLGNEQTSGDLGVGEPACHHREHLGLLGGELAESWSAPEGVIAERTVPPVGG